MGKKVINKASDDPVTYYSVLKLKTDQAILATEDRCK